LTTKDEIKAGLQTIMAVADSIRELGEVPSGTLYAVLMGKLSLEGFNKVLGILKNAGLVTETEGHLLRWTGPAKEVKANP